MEKGHTVRMGRIALWISNAVLMAVAVIASVLYARNVRIAQTETRKADFISTLESMKSVSQNYLDSERGYVDDWASYINDRELTLTEALAFLRSINTNAERFAHIVDMDTFDAWSAYYPAGEEAIDTYRIYADGDLTDWEQMLADMMRQMYDGTAARFSVFGRYKISENLAMAVSVGARITLQTDQGTRDYLLLRVIPTEVLQKTWIFPAEYQSAEVGIITRSGDYVIQSASMKSISFPEYIRGYNFQDDFNRVNSFQKELETTESETLYYKNFRGEDCLWFYSVFDENSDLDILGMIQMKELYPDNDSAWHIVFLICGTLLILAVIDSIYLYQVNVRLRRTAQMAKEASEAKTQFLSAMSHDIRTPMNAVLGMMSLAQKNVNDADYVTQCLEKAMSAGKRLLTLINDVLDISKIESGQFVLTPSEVSVKELFTELVDMFAEQIRDRDLHFTSEVHAITHPVILADSIRLNQIYMNLLSNAIKYTKRGGSIDLKLSEEPASDDTCTCLVFRVSDTGIGMTPEFQRQMYHSFSRAINTQVNRTQGSGLGLSIVRQMVELMGGTITCESAVEKGTTFTVRLELPIVRQQHRTEAEAEDGSSDVSGLHLLVAEDNELNWEIIQAMLEEYGITCERAKNGRICVEMLLASEPDAYDAILMDVQMPEMNGIEACRKIRGLPDTRYSRIPVIAMTADAFAEDVQACMASGMNGHIAKPVDAGKLQGYLRKIRNAKSSKKRAE